MLQISYQKYFKQKNKNLLEAVKNSRKNLKSYEKYANIVFYYLQ